MHWMRSVKLSRRGLSICSRSIFVAPRHVVSELLLAPVHGRAPISRSPGGNTSAVLQSAHLLQTRASAPLSMLLRYEHARSKQYPRQPAQNAACLPIAPASREFCARASATQRGVTSHFPALRPSSVPPRPTGTGAKKKKKIASRRALPARPPTARRVGLAGPAAIETNFARPISLIFYKEDGPTVCVV